MKNSWGCNWGDSGFFKQSWEYNSSSYMFGMEMDLSKQFDNDLPANYENKCVVPQDSDRSDHCRQLSEFGVCKSCNSG